MTQEAFAFSSKSWILVQLVRLLGSFLTLIVGWIPRPLGTLVRGLLYPLFLSNTPWFPYFHGTGIELVSPEQIEIKKRARILRDVCIDATGPQSRICIGEDAWLGRGVEIGVSPVGHCSIQIGDFTYVGTYSVIHGPGNIKIGKNCLIAPQVGIFASNHNFRDASIGIAGQGVTCKGVYIEDDCWLGTGVKVLDGVTVGKGSVVGAGAVVTKSIPPYSVAVGIPAKVVSSRKLSARTISTSATS